jgi:hypothetical protein
MTIKELTVTLKGPLWQIFEISVENIDLTEKWEEEADKGWIKATDFEISDDDLLDVYIKLGAPNRTEYIVEITGKIEAPAQEISYSKNYQVEKNGILRIQISEPLSEIIQ